VGRAAYLLWLAFGMWRGAMAADSGAAVDGAVVVAPGAGTSGVLFRQGLLTNILNPKVAIFFLALLPQFIDSAAADKLLAFLFLGAWFVVQGGLFLVAFVVLVAPLRRWGRNASLRRGLNAVGGGLFAWLALRLALVERT
jgi:threonine/homoserine/homoserine lactone efflux protein